MTSNQSWTGGSSPAPDQRDLITEVEPGVYLAASNHVLLNHWDSFNYDQLRFGQDAVSLPTVELMGSKDLSGTYAYYLTFYDGKKVPWWRRLWRWITRWKPPRYKVVTYDGNTYTLDREIEQ